MGTRSFDQTEPFAILALDGALANRPFFRARFDRPGASELAARLEACSAHDRQWYTLAATYENPRRLRLKRDRTPDFEAGAASIYLRGDALRIAGRPGVSCNIAFSARGAADLAGCLARAIEKMRDWLELRVPSGKRDLVELIPDTEDQPSALEGEIESLGRTGEVLAAQILPREDFCDWEQ